VWLCEGGRLKRSLAVCLFGGKWGGLVLGMGWDGMGWDGMGGSGGDFVWRCWAR